MDAFVEVKEGCGQLRCTQSFFRDLGSMVWTLYLQRRYKLPPPKRLATLASKFDIDVIHTSSTARGGGGSFKKRKTIGEIGCCESRMSKQKH